MKRGRKRPASEIYRDTPVVWKRLVEDFKTCAEEPLRNILNRLREGDSAFALLLVRKNFVGSLTNMANTEQVYASTLRIVTAVFLALLQNKPLHDITTTYQCLIFLKTYLQKCAHIRSLVAELLDAVALVAQDMRVKPSSWHVILRCIVPLLGLHENDMTLILQTTKTIALIGERHRVYIHHVMSSEYNQTVSLQLLCLKACSSPCALSPDFVRDVLYIMTSALAYPDVVQRAIERLGVTNVKLVLTQLERCVRSGDYDIALLSTCASTFVAVIQNCTFWKCRNFEISQFLELFGHILPWHTDVIKTSNQWLGKLPIHDRLTMNAFRQQLQRAANRRECARLQILWNKGRANVGLNCKRWEFWTQFMNLTQDLFEKIVMLV